MFPLLSWSRKKRIMIIMWSLYEIFLASVSRYSSLLRILKPVHWKHDDDATTTAAEIPFSHDCRNRRRRNSLIFTRNERLELKPRKKKSLAEREKKKEIRGDMVDGNRRPIKLSCYRASEAAKTTIFFTIFFFFFSKRAAYDIFHAR